MRQYSYLIFACFCVLTLAQPYEHEIVDGAIYYIMGAGTGKVLDIYAISPVEGAILIQFTKHQGLNQQFKIENATDGKSMIITAMHSGLVLDVAGASTQQGAQIIQWPYYGGPHQRWTVVGRESCWRDENGIPACGVDGFTFVNVHSGLVMTVATDTSLDETSIVQGGTGESVFRLTRVSS